MRVGVDATSWANRRGYGRFARNVVGRLVAAGEDEYVLFTDDRTAREEELPKGAIVRAVTLGRPPGVDSPRSLRDLARVSRAASRERLDVFLFPSVYTWFPMRGAPTVVGIHDVIAEQYPELTLPTHGARARWRLKRRLAVKQAARIFTVSKTSRMLLAADLGVSEASLAVVPEAPDPVFGPRSAEEIERELTPLGLGGGERYLVYAGGISPHKGLETLLDGYAMLSEPAPRLAIAGALEDEAFLSAAGSVRRQIAELGLRDRVLLTGFVSDETLACLYAGSVAFVSPSRSEGFGLPAVEAAAAGTPVVLSDIPAHRETLDGAAFYFRSRDAAALAEQLDEVIGDDALRDEFGAAARQRVAGLSWDASAAALRAVLREAARG
jgi:glycosyltransferase involved in cell wall biosynthesis